MTGALFSCYITWRDLRDVRFLCVEVVFAMFVNFYEVKLHLCALVAWLIWSRCLTCGQCMRDLRDVPFFVVVVRVEVAFVFVCIFTR